MSSKRIELSMKIRIGFQKGIEMLAKHNEEVEALKSEFDTRHLEEELEEMDKLFKNLGSLS